MSRAVQSIPPRIAVIQHQDLVPLDLLADALTDAELTIVRPDAGDPLPALTDVDGVIVLGGTMTAYDDDAAPWLPAVRTFMADAVDQDVATLGICLGAQLLAVALGGEVERSAPGGPERGIVELRMRPDAADDALLGPLVTELGRDVLAPSSHQDAVSALPQDAVWLASSRQYPFQAFRVGSAWGVQFHPEAGVETLVDWAHDHDADDDEVAALRADYDGHAGQLVRLAQIVGGRFVELAGARVAG